MALARYQFTVADEFGNVVPQAFVRVRSERSGLPLATIYSDRPGATVKANPFQADADGFAFFHVQGGAYQIEAFKGAFSRTWRYVGIGLGSETDLNPFQPQGVWSSLVTYDVGDFVEHEGFVFASLVDDNLNSEPSVSGSPAEPATDASWMWIPTLQGATGVGDLYDFSVYVEDRPRASQVIARHIFTSEVTFVEDLVFSQASSIVAATAEAVFTIKKNGTGFSTITFAAASSDGVFSESDITQFFAGDVLTIEAPAVRDATLADVSITLLGNR